MKTTLVENYEFEEGDLFFVARSEGGSTYQKGDFLLLKKRYSGNPSFFDVTNSRTLSGAVHSARFSVDGLTKQLQDGVFEYQGNVKK